MMLMHLMQMPHSFSCQATSSSSCLLCDSVPNPYASLTFDPPGIERYQLRRTFKGHVNAVSAAAFPPHKPILATVSDDATWKLWSVPNCDLVMSGEGHRDWISGVDFHPAGSHLATASGDRTVKI